MEIKTTTYPGNLPLHVGKCKHYIYIYTEIDKISLQLSQNVKCKIINKWNGWVYALINLWKRDILKDYSQECSKSYSFLMYIIDERKRIVHWRETVSSVAETTKNIMVDW